MPRLGDVVAALHERFPTGYAEDWDAVGLVCGDLDSPVGRIHFAVDPTPAVVDEALAANADLLVVHHPLLLRPVNSIAATDWKGQVLQRLIRADCALLTLHTNADSARPGVSDALAAALELQQVQPLAPGGLPLDKLVTFVPHADVEAVLDALAGAGAGAIGDYDRCAFRVDGTGTFRPLRGAQPAIGTVGDVEQVAETRLEMVLPRESRAQVVAALRAAHPYEEVAFDLYEVASVPGSTGLGRVGDLAEPVTFAEFVQRVARALPPTAVGVRGAGDPDRPVRRVAVCGGAGDSLMDSAARSGADVYLTADLRHHPTQEAALRGLALVDATHWATEWLWLQGAADQLVADMSASGSTVEAHVSTISTDPWSLHVGSSA
jgi:dinuclear metal center YbgI/SA1388 family protein